MATVGDQLPTPEAGWKRYDNMHPTIKWDGSWITTYTDLNTYLGTAHYMMLSGPTTSSIEFYFYGTQIRFIDLHWTNRVDNVTVDIDGAISTYNPNNPSNKYKVIVFEKLNLPLRLHKVRLTTTSVSNYFSLDAIDIDDTGEIREPNNKIILSSGGKYYAVNQANPNTNAIPTMTSNTAPNGIASARSIYGTAYDAWKAFNGTVNDAADTWVSNTGQLTGWLKYQFATSKRIYKYAITSRNDATRGNVKDWTFEGSDDNANWEVLDTRTNELNWGVKERREYVVTVPKNFLYYRLNITGVTLISVNFITIGELEMYDDNSMLTELTEVAVANFIGHGSECVLLDRYLHGKVKIETSAITLGAGKTFNHIVDISKRRVNKILLL